MLEISNWQSIRGHRSTKSWVKFNSGLLDDPVFNRMPAESRALLPMLWLLAADMDGKIGKDVPSIAFSLRMREDAFLAALKPLVDSGYVRQA